VLRNIVDSNSAHFKFKVDLRLWFLVFLSHSFMSVTSEARKPLLERNNITRSKPDVSLAAFAFLFSEMVQNAHARVSRVDDLEARYGHAEQRATKEER
jgi:hypothetical protein